jgi:hypothetical protein
VGEKVLSQLIILFNTATFPSSAAVERFLSQSMNIILFKRNK